MAKERDYEVTRHYDIIGAVASNLDLSKTLVTNVYREIHQETLKALYSGTSVSVPGFATYELVDVPARKGRNPRTNEVIDIPAKTVVKVRRRKGLNEVPKYFM